MSGTVHPQLLTWGDDRSGSAAIAIVHQLADLIGDT